MKARKRAVKNRAAPAILLAGLTAVLLIAGTTVARAQQAGDTPAADQPIYNQSGGGGEKAAAPLFLNRANGTAGAQSSGRPAHPFLFWLHGQDSQRSVGRDSSQANDEEMEDLRARAQARQDAATQAYQQQVAQNNADMDTRMQKEWDDQKRKDTAEAAATQKALAPPQVQDRTAVQADPNGRPVIYNPPAQRRAHGPVFLQ